MFWLLLENVFELQKGYLCIDDAILVSFNILISLILHCTKKVERTL